MRNALVSILVFISFISYSYAGSQGHSLPSAFELPDSNGDGVKEVGVFTKQENLFVFEWMDGQSGALIYEAQWNDIYVDETAQVYVFDDATNDNVLEVGLFGTREDGSNAGRYRLDIKDVEQNTTYNIYNWPANWTETYILESDDINNDNVNEIGLVGLFTNGNRPQLKLKDGASSTTSLTFGFPPLYENVSIHRHSDRNDDGIEDIALFGKKIRNGKLQARVVNATSPNAKFKPYNFPNRWQNEQWLRLFDMNQDGIDDWGMFGQLQSDGRPNLIVRNGADSRGRLNTYAWPGIFDDYELIIVPDMNNDGLEDIAVAGTLTSNGNLRFMAKSGADKTVMLANRTWPGQWSNVTFKVFEDMTGDGKAEIGFIGQSNDTGHYELVVDHGDSSLGNLHTYDLGTDWTFPPQVSLSIDSNDNGLSNFHVFGLTQSQQTVTRLEDDATVSFVVPYNGQAILGGPLSGAQINVYRVSDVDTPIETTITTTGDLSTAGRFRLRLKGVADDEWLLVKATGGEDVDFDNDGELDTSPTDNTATLYAFANAKMLREQLNITLLSHAAWRYAAPWLGAVSEADLAKRLDAIAEAMLLPVGDEKVDYADVRAFGGEFYESSPLTTESDALFDSDGFVTLLRGELTLDEEKEQLDNLFGANLNFGIAPSETDDVAIQLIVAGDGAVSSSNDMFTLSTARGDRPVSTEFVALGQDDITLTASAASGSSIQRWRGCDWVSEDLEQCRFTPNQDRLIELSIGYDETILKATHIDLATANIIQIGTQLTISVDELDDELLTNISSLNVDVFISGVSDSGPFFYKVIELVSADEQAREWVVDTEQGALTDLISQGSGFASAAFRAENVESVELATGILQSQQGSGQLYYRPSPTDEDKIQLFFGRPGLDTQSTDGLVDIDLGYNQATITWEDDETKSTLTLFGSTEFGLTMNMDIDIGFSGVKLLKVIPEANFDSNLSISTSGTLTTPRSKDEREDAWRFQLGTIRFSPINVMVGVFPVTVQPIVELYVGVNGELTGEASFSAGASMSAQAGFVYTKDAGFNLIGEVDTTYQLPQPSLSGTARMKGYLEARVIPLFYGFEGPMFPIQAYVEGKAVFANDTSCVASLDYGLWTGVDARAKWLLLDKESKLGKLLQMDIEIDSPLFDVNKKLFGGFINGCGDEPPVLQITGNNINSSITAGATDVISTEYTIVNTGDTSMPWSIDFIEDGALSVSPASGTLEADEEQVIEVTIDEPEDLREGLYTRRLEINNNYQGVVGKSGLGSTQRYVNVQVNSEDFTAPVLNSAERLSTTSITVTWDHLDANRANISAYRVVYTEDETLESGWTSLGQTNAQQTSLRVTNAPTKDIYVAVEVVGVGSRPQIARSNALLVLAEGSVAINEGLIAYYEFESNGADSSGNGKNMSEVGNIEYSNDGVLGQSALFDGEGSYFVIDEVLLPQSSEIFSVAGWIKIDDPDRGSIFGQFPANDTRDTNKYISLDDNNDLIYDEFKPTLGGLHSNNPLEQNKWIHFAVVRSGSNRKIFIDNELVQEDNSAETYSGSNVFQTAIGARLSGGEVYETTPKYEFKGNIDELRVYNRALSPDEIRELASNENNGLVAYLPFDSDASDSSNFSNNGELENGAEIADSVLDVSQSSNARVSIPNSDSLNITGDISVAAWVKRTSPYTTTHPMIILKGDVNTSYLLWPSADNTTLQNSELAFRLVSASGQRSHVYSGVSLDLDTWYHVVGTRKGNVMNIYVNGILRNSISTFSEDIAVNDGPLTIGDDALDDFRDSFPGYIDDVKIYDRALSQVEIQSLAQTDSVFLWDDHGEGKLTQYLFDGINTESDCGSKGGGSVWTSSNYRDSDSLAKQHTIKLANPQLLTGVKIHLLDCDDRTYYIDSISVSAGGSDEPNSLKEVSGQTYQSGLDGSIDIDFEEQSVQWISFEHSGSSNNNYLHITEIEFNR